VPDAPCSILLIEDDAEYRTMVRRLLAAQPEANLSLHEAADLHEGLRLIAADGFDLVLLDHTLPHGSALDDLREVRAQHPQLPVVLHTGYLTPEQETEALAHGARGVVIKGPFAHLWTAMQRVCPQLGRRDARPTGPSGITVLVVEDNADVRRMVERTLREEGYGVVVAEHGKRALELIEALPDAVDVVFADIRMPQMGGPELGRILAERHSDLPVIYTSGWPEEQLRHESRELPAAASFLAKPFSPPALLAALERILARSTRQQPPG
jgi:CheY-like chemotaxis protein